MSGGRFKNSTLLSNSAGNEGRINIQARSAPAVGQQGSPPEDGNLWFSSYGIVAGPYGSLWFVNDDITSSSGGLPTIGPAR